VHEVSLTTLELARRLFRQHAGQHREPLALALAAEHASERLRRRLAPLIGRTGYTALFRRALRLAQGEFPVLGSLTADEGTGPVLTGAREFAAAYAQDPDMVEAALVAILAQLIALLDTFIGAAITRRVIGEDWSERDDETETAK